jgi:DNA-binding Lrp family transcriptional regulator
VGSARQKKEAARVGLDGFRETAEMSTDTHIMPDSPEKVKVRIETGFYMVPASVARVDDISGTTKLLFGCIYSLAHTESGCYGSNKALAKRLGLSIRQVQRMLFELEEHGLIKRHYEGVAKDRPVIEVLWRLRLVRPRKGDDKNVAPPTPVTNMSRVPRDGSVTGPMTDLSRGRASAHCDKERVRTTKAQKSSGSNDPERISSKIAEPSDESREGSPPSRPDQEDPEAVASAWRAFRAGLATLSKQAIDDALSNPKSPLADDPTNNAEIARQRGRKAKPIPMPEEAPVQDDPVMQAEVAMRQEMARLRAKQNGESKP